VRRRCRVAGVHRAWALQVEQARTPPLSTPGVGAAPLLLRQACPGAAASRRSGGTGVRLGSALGGAVWSTARRDRRRPSARSPARQRRGSGVGVRWEARHARASGEVKVGGLPGPSALRGPAYAPGPSGGGQVGGALGAHARASGGVESAARWGPWHRAGEREVRSAVRLRQPRASSGSPESGGALGGGVVGRAAGPEGGPALERPAALRRGTRRGVSSAARSGPHARAGTGVRVGGALEAVMFRHGRGVRVGGTLGAGTLGRAAGVRVGGALGSGVAGAPGGGRAAGLSD
jgi:hypothetical protein